MKTTPKYSCTATGDQIHSNLFPPLQIPSGFTKIANANKRHCDGDLCQGKKGTPHFHDGYFQRDKNRVEKFQLTQAKEPTKNLVLVTTAQESEGELVTNHQSKQQTTRK